MPTYEYECRKCGHRFETVQSIKADPLKTCESCGGELRRLVGTGAGFLFKGSGFYQTDYRSDSYQKKAKEETGSKAEKGGKTEKAPDPPKKKESPGGGSGGRESK